MANRDILHRVYGDIASALGLLTRLPLPGAPDVPRGAAAAWAWPLAGLAPAGLAALAIWLTAGLGAGIAAATGLATRSWSPARCTRTGWPIPPTGFGAAGQRSGGWRS